jgi:nickel transport protein
MAERRRLALAAPLLLVLASLPALAHQIDLFAWAEGSRVRGRVSSSGHGFPAHVVAYGTSGEVLADVQAGDDGLFAFEVRAAVDHRIVADAGDGHRAEHLVRADELGGGAPARASGPLPAALEAAVERAVAHELGPLREELAAFEARARWRDAVAGFGYILGLTGAAFFVLARRSKRS